MIGVALAVALAVRFAPDPSAPAGSPAPQAPSSPLPGLPPGAPAWLSWIGWALAALSTMGVGAVILRVVDGMLNRRKLAVDTDEVMTRVAVTLVEPLRDRLDRTERRLTEAEQRHERERAEWHAARDAERAEFEQQADSLRGKIREALAEADGAVAEAHRLRRLVQQWHRAIMDPTATIEWLRQLVGPDEPAI